jgi:hypothetical protein
VLPNNKAALGTSGAFPSLARLFLRRIGVVSVGYLYYIVVDNHDG